MADFVSNEGRADPNAPVPMYWQSSFTTRDGTLIEWGTGDHNNNGDNGVREYNPINRTQTYVYPNNNGTRDVTQYDNHLYWYIPRIDSLVIPSRGQYARSSRSWVRGENSSFFPNGPRVMGSGANDLIRSVGSVDVVSMQSSYNSHAAWSAQFDAGVAIGGCGGCEKDARPTIWMVVPGQGLGVSPQPYAVVQRALPASVGGAAPNLSNGRDGCCFLGEYVYWVGGTASGTTTNMASFFRMSIAPHLFSSTATLQIERLPDAPAAFKMGLLRADPYNNALLCVCDRGVFVYDVSGKSWIVVTPSGYTADYVKSPANGTLPAGCMGDFIDGAGGQTLRRFYWRAGRNGAWAFDGADTPPEMTRQFRSIKLARRS